MAQSLNRKIKRGHIKMIWNPTFNRMDSFRKSSKGMFILCNPYVGRDIQPGPGAHPETVAKWESA